MRTLVPFRAAFPLVAILIAAASGAHAQALAPLYPQTSVLDRFPAETGGPLTLAAALDLALKANPDISVALREREASEGAVIQGRARPNPSVDYLVEDSRAATRTTTLQLNQPIEVAGKRSARMAIAERGRDIADIELATRRAEIRASVVSAFFEVLSAQERTRLAREAVSLAERATDAVSKRVIAGKVSPVEETRARVAEAGTRVELAQAQGELRVARQRLTGLWGNPVPRFERAEGDVGVLPPVPSVDLVAQRIAASPVLTRATIEITRRASITALERARRLPDPSITLGLKRAEELGRDQVLVGVSIPIPLLDSNRGNLLEALKREDKARDELTALQVRLTGDVLQARERLSNSRLELESLQRDVLPGAQLAYDKASKGFELGKFSFLDVLDAQRTLFQARNQYLRTLTDTHRAAAEIDRLLADRSAE
ncbi:TolC family protein [Zoogloea sp.]|uniref:TolC family protein n=1 Tax=Zoogloea sp. TaxID=49181 RepID=UPI001416C18E|nr:MAG: TolC family protein [Zoogloea sp.]